VERVQTDMCAPTNRNILVHVSKILPTSFTFYGIKKSISWYTKPSMYFTPKNGIIAYCIKWYYYTSCYVQIHTPQFCLYLYPQDPNYNISHTTWHWNTLLNKNTIKNKNKKFPSTTSPTLMPILVVNKPWTSNSNLLS
jgi:hypothetical protein